MLFAPGRSYSYPSLGLITLPQYAVLHVRLGLGRAGRDTLAGITASVSALEL
jgi:hypothetical protein